MKFTKTEIDLYRQIAEKHRKEREDNIRRDMIIDNRLGIKKPEMTEEWIEKLIDDIIELILDDMDCHHEVDYEEDGAHLSVEYNLNNETKLRGIIRKLIQKSQVTEEWIEEKARDFLVKTNISVQTPEAVKQQLKIIKDFIHSFIKEIQGGNHD